jgi:uncharacterized membrane protein
MEKNSTRRNIETKKKTNIKKLVTILIALIITCSIIVTGVIIYAPRSEGYHVMYILNTQNQAVNHEPQILVINQNSTFNTKVVVENNKPTTCNYQIQIKIVKDTFSFPINAPTYETYEFPLNPKQSWNNQVPISIKEEGEFSIVFELYAEKEENYRFTDNYCVLHIKAITSTS